MDVTSPQAGTAFAATATRAQETAAATSSLSSDFETFLKMLTVQMENQDPLNPVDSSEFAMQLASFSSVEQQVKTNELLGGLAGQMSLLGLGQLQGWVGMDARARMPVHVDGGAVDVRYDTAAGADLAVLVVRDARGAIVHQEPVAPGGGSHQWSGRDETGAALPEGLYELSVDSFQGDALLGSVPAETSGRIIEARQSGGTTMLVMDGGQILPAGDVIALRRPDE